jgi:hypothetical protein
VSSERLRLLLVISSERLRLLLLLVIMVGGFNVVIIMLSVVVRAAGVGAKDADVGFRVLLLVLMLVVVRACEGDDEIAIGLSSQLLAADSGRRLHKLLVLGRGDCSTDEVGDALLAWTIWRTAASSPCSGTETLLV